MAHADVSISEVWQTGGNAAVSVRFDVGAACPGNPAAAIVFTLDPDGRIVAQLADSPETVAVTSRSLDEDWIRGRLVAALRQVSP